MAVDVHLKFEPPVEGESVVKGHEKEIHIHAINWGMSQSGSMHTGTGGGSAKVTVKDISFAKSIDKSTPVLMHHCCNGQHFDKATVTVSKAGGDKSVQYLTITMHKVMISGIDFGGHKDSEDLKESVKLNFSKFTVEYKPQTEKGVEGAGVKSGWDIAGSQDFG